MFYRIVARIYIKIVPYPLIALIHFFNVSTDYYLSAEARLFATYDNKYNFFQALALIHILHLVAQITLAYLDYVLMKEK